MKIDKDAFSNGQIDSKIWLCRELEKLFEAVDHIYIYGGWYGITAFLLRVRDKIEIQTIKSYDIDTECQPIADMINENWVIKEWQFKSFTEDCNQIKPKDVDLIINTSTEHFDSKDWWHNIPKGTIVALQGNNMSHEDHKISTESLDDFVKEYPLTQLMYKGSLDFKYPEWSFTRFMIIGIK